MSSTEEEAQVGSSSLLATVDEEAENENDEGLVHWTSGDGAGAAWPAYNVREDFFLEYDAWLETRLHPLKIIDGVIEAAFAGRVSELEERMKVVERQGVDFVASLKRTPCPKKGVQLWFLAHGSSATAAGDRSAATGGVTERKSAGGDGPGEAETPPRWLWEWVCSRLADLQAADAQLVPLVSTAKDILEKAGSGRRDFSRMLAASPGKSRTSKLIQTAAAQAVESPVLKRMSQKARKASVVSVWEELARAHAASSSRHPSRSAHSSQGSDGGLTDSAGEAAELYHKSVSTPAVLDHAEHGGPTTPAEPRASIPVTRRASTSLFTKAISEKDKKSAVSHIRQLYFGSVQDQLTWMLHELSGAVARLDKSLGVYVSAARSSAGETLELLRDTEARLFVEYLNTEHPVEQELRLATGVDPRLGLVPLERLASALLAAQRVIGSQSLIGEASLRKAAAVGAGREELDGEPFPENPWANFERRTPWSGSFDSALDVFVWERRRQEAAAGSSSAETGEIRRLRIWIYSARGLRKADWCTGEGTSDPYCMCELAGHSFTQVKTQVIEDDCNPVWDCTLEMDRITMRDTVNFSVWDRDGITGEHDDLLGRTFLTGIQAILGFDSEVPLYHTGTDGEAYIRVRTEALPLQGG